MAEEGEKIQRSPEERMRRRRRLIVIAILVLISTFGVFSNYGMLTRLRLDRHRSELNDSLDVLRSVHDSLRLRADQLRRDTLEIERLAREKYGMSKPGEQVYIIRDEQGK